MGCEVTFASDEAELLSVEGFEDAASTLAATAVEIMMALLPECNGISFGELRES